MPSFDVKCGFDMQEMDNAVNMVKRDILNRLNDFMRVCTMLRH